MNNRYRARVTLASGQRHTIGYFDTHQEMEAAKMAYRELHGLNSGMTQAVNQAAMGMANMASAVRAMNCPQPVDTSQIPDNINLIDKPPLTLDLDSFAYCSDIHAPLHSREMLRRLVTVMDKRGIGHLIIGGDLFDLDRTSRHPNDSQQATINDTLRIGGDILHLLLAMFDVTVLPGNHDRRVAVKLDEPLAFDALVWASLRGRTPAHKLTITDYDYVYVRDSWVMGHPRFYSRTPKALADVAQQQQRNVIGAHTHLLGLMYSADGKWIAIDPGCMCEESLTPYHMRSAGLSRFPQWKRGFVIVEHNIPTLYGDGITNWSAV